MAKHIVHTVRTLLFGRLSATSQIQEGEKKEFLRGTFDMMDIDEQSKEDLDSIKKEFMKCKKELGGLEVEEFEAALRPYIAKGVSDNHIRTIFRKMDTCDQGAVSWEEFINFAITEHSMRLKMEETMDEMPFGQQVHIIKHQHRDPIMCISFMPNIDVNAKTIDWNFGKYIILSREGVMSVWSLSMKVLSYNNLVVDSHKEQSWFLDMVCLYHNGYIATISSCRDLAMYDYTQRGWMRKYHIRNLDSNACCMSYWAGLKTEQVVICMGDTSGTVMLLEFDLSNLTPMFGFSVREGCYSFYWSDVTRGMCTGTTARVYSHVHNNWVKEVRYVPEINSILSCCSDSDTAMHMTFVDPKKRTPVYFNCIKGILCFDYSHALNVLACAGIESNIMLFNPYVPRKLVASIEAHIAPILHIAINENEKYSISVDMGKTMLICSLTTYRILQRIPGQSVHTGLHNINTMFLHCARRVCLLGSKSIARIRRHKLDDAVQVDVRSHDFKLVGALYSPEFEQVVSACRGSMVRVWDLNTGTRVMQFPRAHEKKSQGEWIPVEIECIALSENKRRLFTAAEGVVKIWNFNTGSVLRTIDMSECAKIISIVMAKKMIYVTGWHKVVTVLSDFKGEEGVKRTWAASHNSDILNLCIMEPNMLASSSYDGTVTVWSRESTDAYCTLHATFGPKPELATAVRAGGNKQNIMHVAAGMEDEPENESEAGEDSFMTIGLHLRKDGGWYRLLRALKKRQIEREKKRAAKERKDFTARYKKKKTRMNMQGLSLIYESAVESMVFLGNRRLIDPHTATLVLAGAECWIRFWSIHPRGGILAQFNASRRKLESIRVMATDKENEYLFTGDTLGFLRIFDIKEFCNVDKLTSGERAAREKSLHKDFVYLSLPFKPEQMHDTMEKLREKRISVPDASKPRNNLKSPRLLSSIRAHILAITGIEFVEERGVIITSSHDLTVRLWTKNCTYIGTFGETWNPLPRVVGRVVTRPPRIPNDVVRVASAHSLGTLHNGKHPLWSKASYIVRRHIYELRKERDIERIQQKLKAERLARGEPDSDDDSVEGEKPVSKILGKQYKTKKWYLGPITTKDQNLPPLRVFRGRCSPYNSTKPREFTCMTPLFKPSTFFEIDTRRKGIGKSKRVTRQMMNTFNILTCNAERYGMRPGMSTASICSTVPRGFSTSTNNINSTAKSSRSTDQNTSNLLEKSSSSTNKNGNLAETPSRSTDQNFSNLLEKSSSSTDKNSNLLETPSSSTNKNSNLLETTSSSTDINSNLVKNLILESSSKFPGRKTNIVDVVHNSDTGKSKFGGITRESKHDNKEGNKESPQTNYTNRTMKRDTDANKKNEKSKDPHFRSLSYATQVNDCKLTKVKNAMKESDANSSSLRPRVKTKPRSKDSDVELGTSGNVTKIVKPSAKCFEFDNSQSDSEKEEYTFEYFRDDKDDTYEPVSMRLAKCPALATVDLEVGELKAPRKKTVTFSNILK